MLTPPERAHFEREGLLVLRGWSPPNLVIAAREASEEQLIARRDPLELEVDVGYPGAPGSRSTAGGDTVRRLLRAYERDESFRALGTSGPLGAVLRELMTGATGDEAAQPSAPVLLVQSHHNCVMTKMPSFSSATHWHQDIRYWSYQRPELISAWFALGSEIEENGCLSFIPGTHRMRFGHEQLDERQFLRTERDDNQMLLATRVTPSLAPGDLVLFHCRLFHAAGSNFTTTPKFSLVYTYRAAGNSPLAGTKSASLADIPI
ncbi:MAG: phytanoyl-CoA dioxygenase family protein [Proteobacteria bacterium]|nr:phytanoyl-CoA dioxygenase family protein [Burkholderiales bacterium]